MAKKKLKLNKPKKYQGGGKTKPSYNFETLHNFDALATNPIPSSQDTLFYNQYFNLGQQYNPTQSTYNQLDRLRIEAIQNNDKEAFLKYSNMQNALKDAQGKKKFQDGGQNSPIYTSNPNDPRLQAYKDSLLDYNTTINRLSIIGNTGKTPNPVLPNGIFTPYPWLS